MGDRGLGRGCAEARVLGPVHLHVWLHQGDQAGWPVQEEPERHNVPAGLDRLRILPRANQDLCPLYIENGTVTSSPPTHHQRAIGVLVLTRVADVLGKPRRR